MPEARVEADHDWRRLFVGRDRELNLLIEAWRHAKAGEPQFIVFLGESGLGKTRLVQEFYRWLSRNEDPASQEAPEGYWPDAFETESTSLDVNPRFATDDRPRPKIPWLWWGIRFNRPEVRNQVGSECGIVDYRDALFIHTQPITISRRLKEVRAEAALKTASMLAELVPWAGLAFAVRDLHSLVTAELAEHRALTKQATESPAQAYQRERTNLESIALDYFRTILDPGNVEAETVPVILMLDDAQWADPVTLRFLRKLLGDALTGRWPLLVIATHWEVEWHRNLSEQADAVDNPRWLTDLPRLLGLAPAWPGLRHVKPIADLGGIIEAALPGLSSPQRLLLLEKAGGNPLLLEEMLLFVIREPRFFEDHDTSRSLTVQAIGELQRRTFKLHDLVRDRFARLEATVKRALGWSSEQGLRFLTDITLAAARRVAPELAEADLREALHKGETPHCFVQLDHDGGRFNRGEFRQAAFHHIAAEYLAFDASELAGVQLAVRDTLVEWLGDEAIDSLPAVEQRDALLTARCLLRPVPNSPSTLWCAWALALVRLSRVYAREFLWEQAWETAEAFADARPSAWGLDLVTMWDQIEIIDRLSHARDYRRAQLLARPLLLSLESRSATDQQGLRDLSVSLNKVGDVERALGDRKAALSAYRRGLEISERISREYGETPESLRDLSVSLDRVGDVERALGDREAALSAYRRGLEISERISREYGETPESLRDLSVSLDRVGDVERALGDREAALSAYRRGLEISERISREYGETPESLRDLSVSLDRVGDVERALGDREAALSAYRRGLEIRERISREYGETPESLRDLSVSLNKVGDVERALGDREAALSAYRRGLEISERISREYGETPESLRDLSVSLNKVGDVERALGDREAALSAYRRGLEIRERISREYGETPESLRDLSVSLDRVGDVELALGDREAALSAYRRGLEISERISREYGETPESLRDLSVSLNKVGDVERALGDREAALSAYRRGLEISERISREYGETPESLRDLSVSLDRVGDVERALGDREAALSAYRRGLEISERISREYGETPESLRDLSVSLDRVGDVERALGDREAALSAYRRGLEIRERISREYGETPESLRDLSVSLDRVGDVERALGDREAALSAYRRGLEISERISREYGETPESLRDIVISDYKLAVLKIEIEDEVSATAHLERARDMTQSIVDKGWGLPQNTNDLRLIEGLLLQIKGHGTDAVK